MYKYQIQWIMVDSKVNAAKQFHLVWDFELTMATPKSVLHCP